MIWGGILFSTSTSPEGMMNCPGLVSITDKEAFEDALEVLLNDNFDSLPLEVECVEGGFPDPMSVDVYDVKRTGESGDQIFASFSVSFTETINTSCGDVTIDKNRNVFCSIVIDKALGEADIEVEESHSDDEPEF